MALDPTDPDVVVELASDELPQIDVEAPENDTAEQHAELTEDRDDPLEDVDPARANEADLVEQARVVGLDEDDYR
ncbi:hypothetical protein [Streptomyces sp. NPDC086787]|uniref:hypothetical protein n=1 Tax=Streptomyces sp. NPDC086787 TaxID=3365759 RepID=UPI003817284C